MAGNLAILSNLGVFLNFDKRTDLCVISNFTTVEIDEFGHLDVSAECYVG
jgi:hypothetical protein